jgi:hypothetical protein
MHKRKTAAICFFGQARTLNLCYPYIKKNLLDPLGKNGKDYDIFCCVEDDEDGYKINLLNPTKILKIKSENTEKILRKDINFLERQNYKKFISRIDSRTPHPIRNLLQLLYKKKLCYNLLEEHISEKKIEYKYFIRTRFDLLLIDKIDLSKIKILEKEIFVPLNKEITQLVQGIDDCFCVSSSLKTFRHYCNIINNLKNLMLNRHSLQLSLFAKFYFAIEKKYKSFLIKFLKGKNYFKATFYLLTFIPDILFYRNLRKKMIGIHRLLPEHIQEKGYKIKNVKLNYALMRKGYKSHKGILRIED